MRITEVKTELLHMPLPRPMQSGSSSGKKGGPVSHINMPIVFITTEDGTRGLGYAWSLLGGATATRCVLRDDFAPLLIDEDALDHERLWHKLYKRLQSVGRRGLVTQAQAAVDLALWDIKGKISGLPVYKLLGGCRESAPVYGSDGGWLYMSVSEMLAAFEDYLVLNVIFVINIQKKRPALPRLGKFFKLNDPKHDRSLRIKGEYDKLQKIRGYGFDTSPNYVVRPISRENRIGLALIEEFIHGKDLDHYFKKAIYEGDGASFKETSKLASFLYILHKKTEKEENVELDSVNVYFQKILNKLCQQEIIYPSDKKEYLKLWINGWPRLYFRRRRMESFMGIQPRPILYLLKEAMWWRSILNG